MIENHLRVLREKLDIYSSSCNNFIIVGDFIIEMEEQQTKAFCDNCGLGLIRQPTYYNSTSSVTCSDLILTNAP